MALQLNLSTKNDKLREFFQTRDVRIAILSAIDRDLLNELVYSGLGYPAPVQPGQCFTAVLREVEQGLYQL